MLRLEHLELEAIVLDLVPSEVLRVGLARQGETPTTIAMTPRPAGMPLRLRSFIVNLRLVQGDAGPFGLLQAKQLSPPSRAGDSRRDEEARRPFQWKNRRHNGHVNTPYADQVGDRNPVEVLTTSLADYRR